MHNHYWSKRPDLVRDKVTGEIRKTPYERVTRVPNWNGLCYTITTCFSFKHPLLDRALSIRENAIIQSFPDDFIFIGARTNAQRQIGNAVPPKMAKAIGETVKEMLDESN